MLGREVGKWVLGMLGRYPTISRGWREEMEKLFTRKY
jgi:hypothetical protein